MRIKLLIPTLLCGLTLASCSDSTTTTPITATSTSKVEYTYTGELSGTFKANGAFPSLEIGEGVTSTLSSDRKKVEIRAVAWTKAGQANFIVINLTSANAIVDNQTFTLTDANSQASIVSGYGIAYPNYAPSDAYTIRSGSVVLSTVKDSQIKGTFDANVENGAGKKIAITAGKIDVKY
jgi:uncharacterized protein affecting Mg2+/Co2+ transport